VRKRLLWSCFLGLALTAVSCSYDQKGASSESVETPATAPSGFEPNPQKLPETEVSTLELGSPAPDFNLPGVDGRFYRLSDFSEAEVLAVIFTCNHCPTAQAYEERIKQITADYRDRGVAIVGISPNSPVGLLYEEMGYSDMGDDFYEMQIRSRDHEFNFPYLYDGDTHEASIQYGPVATPHAFVFDADRRLRYVGRIDGSEKPGTGNGEDLRAAIESLLDGRPVENPRTNVFGCSVKWGWNTDWRERVDREWAAAPVSLEEVDVGGVRELVANRSEKLRLVNLWATWCGPCVIEYPEFIVIHRMFKDRDFEFVSLSIDSPAHREDAVKFLEKRDSAVRNLLFVGEDRDELVRTIDPEWDGAIPYTLLVEPGGKVVYRQMGPIDPLEVKRAIVDHELIGRYY
jgi:thiol-disulfide isomerase/thioredoxin